MRITYLHQYFNTPDMPGSTRSYELGRRLVSKGHEVNLITAWREADGRSEPFQTQEAGIRVHWLPVAYSNHMSYSARVRAFFDFAWRSARLAAAIEADVIFASSTPLTIALPGVFAARRRRLPMVFEVRDLWPELPIAVGAIRNPLLKTAAFRLEQFAYRNAAMIVALSDGMRDGIVATGVEPGKVEVITNTSDIVAFRPDRKLREEFRSGLGIDDETTLLTYAGTFGLINDVGWLVRLAFELRSERRLRFLAIGSGQQYAAVERLAAELGCLDVNLTLRSSLPKTAMPSVFAASDIAISTVIPIPELEANSANKFFDALAAGCCMCVNHGGWQADLLEAEGAGLRLPREIPAAAEVLRRWLDDPQAIRKAGERARALAEERFATDRLAARLEVMLATVYQRHRIVPGGASR
jgi:glycosyltransferase involved in cell wall biosynthesis